MARKEIVAKFNRDLTKIEFYEIVDNFKRFTILRRQGTDIYYAWDNRNKLFTMNDLNIDGVPFDKEDYYEIFDNVDNWYCGVVFFWADSKFVNEYGLPHYDKLVNIYKELLNVKNTEVEILNTLAEVKKNEGLIAYLRCRMIANRFLRMQKKSIKKLEKEFKLIW